MEKLLQGSLGIALLMQAGQCVSNVPTGEELFEMQQQAEPKLVVEWPGNDVVECDVFC